MKLLQNSIAWNKTELESKDQLRSSPFLCRQVLDDWRYVALVLDRLQLYLFLAIIIAGTVGILIHAPHIFDFIDQEKIVDLIKESQDGYPVFDN